MLLDHAMLSITQSTVTFAYYKKYKNHLIYFKLTVLNLSGFSKYRFSSKFTINSLSPGILTVGQCSVVFMLLPQLIITLPYWNYSGGYTIGAWAHEGMKLDRKTLTFAGFRTRANSWLWNFNIAFIIECKAFGIILMK